MVRNVELSEESASEVEQQLLNMKNKNKKLYGQSSMIREDSDTSSDECINIFQQKKIVKDPKSVMAEQTTVDTVSEHQYTELSNVNLIPFTSSENIPLNTS
uniref:Uncharacterized protein n=1 Tax=Sipha flava TaxID=143950 RepID=A0A2S2QTH0_9HEMI